MACDRITEGLLWGMVVFSPWALGTTQPWSIAVMNAGGLLLGALFVSKLVIRKASGWTPDTWAPPLPRWLITTLGVITAFLLLYSLLSAVNARATFSAQESSYVYRECLMWLPHSYDAGSTWTFLRRWLALALVFWAVRDFLVTTSSSEPNGYRLPARVQRLLWVLAINGGLLALEGLVQRTLGSSELLWIIEPRINKSPEAQFGPYAYRSNAAQYFLMVWPLTLGLWATLRQTRRPGRVALHNYLLGPILVMAIVPFFALSRAGAIIGAATLIGISLVLLLKGRQRRDRASVALAITLLAGVVLGGLVEWNTLAKRFQSDPLDSGRMEIWRNTWEIFKDYPVYGTGPGTFASVYHVYRPSVQEDWAAHAHNDWLELLMTFGLVGAIPVLLGIGLVLLWRLSTGSGLLPGTFRSCVYLSLASCLAYAAVDMPFKVYSVSFVFVLVASLATLDGGRRSENVGLNRR